MNKNASPGLSITSLILTKYRPFLIPIGVICSCFLLFLLVVIPQFQSYQEKDRESKEVRARIEILKSNLTLLQGIDDAKHDLDFQTSITALPSEKDFAGIINAISQASSKTSILIKDYQFQVGSLATQSAQEVSEKLSITFSLDLEGGIPQLRTYIPELYKTFPLSKVSEVDSQSTLSRMGVAFFSKPVPLENIRLDSPLAPLTSAEETLLSELHSFESGL